PEVAKPSPLLGRWQTEITTDDGKKYNCLMDLTEDQQMAALYKQMGKTSLNVAYSDECPFPLCGASGKLLVAPDGSYAPTVFRAGKDTGTYMFQVPGMEGFSGAYRIEGENTMVTSSAQQTELRWQRVKADGPLPNGANVVLPEKIAWPMKDVPGFVQRA